ncbi:hypothetical protein ACFPJ4_03505 [Lysinimonas soli]|uniref:DUF2127 domain-containing protein n=1 Tax=Lysinimonas soli TaxID=1074233 RepID=A0ABW0NNG4_9MICO
MAGVKVPAATATAAIATLVEGTEYLVRFIGLVVAFSASGRQAALPFLIPVVAIPLAMFVLTAFLLRRGTRWATIPVTILSLWTGTNVFFYYHDALAWFALVVSTVAIVACWLPSARQFAREATFRRSSSAEVPAPRPTGRTSD